MTANPVDLVYVDNVAVAKADVRSYEKNRVRMRMGDANEVRNTILGGQFAGIYIPGLRAFFDLDTSDTTTADDGVNCIISSDGYRFKKVSITPSQVVQSVTSGPTAPINADADIVIVNQTVGAPITLTLPAAASKTTPVLIIDWKGDAGTNAITIAPNGSELIQGKSQWTIGNDTGSVFLRPIPATGYGI